METEHVPHHVEHHQSTLAAVEAVEQLQDRVRSRSAAAVR